MANCLADRAVARLRIKSGGKFQPVELAHLGFEPCVRRQGHWFWHRDQTGFRWLDPYRTI